MKHCNDAMYLLKDSTSSCERWQAGGKKTSKFLQTKSPSSTTEISSFTILIIQTIRNLSGGEKLLLHCKSKYKFLIEGEISKRELACEHYSVVGEERVKHLHNI